MPPQESPLLEPRLLPRLEPDTARALALVALRTGSAVVLGDRAGFITWVNDAFARLTGLSPVEVVGKRIDGLRQALPVERAALEPLLAQLARGESARVELRTTRRDGTPLWLAVEVHPLGPERGEMTHFLAIATDLSEERLAQERQRQLTERMREVERTEELQVLAGGVAHDFNNVLGAILGNADLVLADLPEDSPLRGPLLEIRRQALRATSLTDRMLSYAGGRPLAPRPLDLSNLVVGSSHRLDTFGGERTSIGYELMSDLPRVRADAGALRQVLLNLVRNAIEALPPTGGQVRVRTGVRQLGPEDLGGLRPPDQLRAGRHVFLEVEDTGCGMDGETQARAFDPFFTTKEPGRGLGLAASLGIARAHGGAFALVSSPGRGTRIALLLPASESAEEGTPRLRRRPPAIRGRRILVVEDEPALRRLARVALERAGFEVMEAADGRAGLERFRAHAASIAAVVVDLTMPGLKGDELLRRIRRIRRSTRILLTSGYADPSSAGLPADPGVAFLRKPYAPAELVAMLRALLQS